MRWGDNSLFSFSKCSFNCNCHLLHSTFDLCYVNYKNKTFSLHLPHITSVSMCISVTQGKRSIFSWKCQMKKHFRIRSYPIDLYRLFSQISCVKFKSSAHFICIVFFFLLFVENAYNKMFWLNIQSMVTVLKIHCNHYW